MLKILHTNDMHGTMTGRTFEALSKLRQGCDLYFDSGDSIKTGNLGIPVRPDPVWESFTKLDLTASVLGNRETHPLKAAFDLKVSGATHPILVANISNAQGGTVFPGSMILEVRGIKVGILGVMVPMATIKKKDRALWANLWVDPIKKATEVVEDLRPNVDLLIALTHIGYTQDVKLAAQCPGIDIIFGGHSHTVLDLPEKHGNAYICQGGSHNRFAGVYTWDEGTLTGTLLPLSQN